MFILDFALGRVNIKRDLHNIVSAWRRWFLLRADTCMRLLEQVLGSSFKTWHASRKISSRKTQIIGYDIRESEESELEEKLLRDISQTIQRRLETNKLNLNLRSLQPVFSLQFEVHFRLMNGWGNYVCCWMVKDVSETFLHELSRICNVQILSLKQIDLLKSSIWNISFEKIIKFSGLYEIPQVWWETQHFRVVVLGSDHIHHVVEDISYLLHLYLGLVASIRSLLLTLETTRGISTGRLLLLQRYQLIHSILEIVLYLLELCLLLLVL